MKITDKKKPINTTPKGVWEGSPATNKNEKPATPTLTTDLQGNGYPVKQSKLTLLLSDRLHQGGLFYFVMCIYVRFSDIISVSALNACCHLGDDSKPGIPLKLLSQILLDQLCCFHHPCASICLENGTLYTEVIPHTEYKI